MNTIVNFPLPLSVFAFFVLWGSAVLGAIICKRVGRLPKEERDDFGVVQGASLTLLGLLIGFTFSMSISRYDLRKNYEESEANAIGTEYVRVGLLSPPETVKLRELLRRYLDLRIRFYTARRGKALLRINDDTAQLQSEMWSAVQARAELQPTPTIALIISGMNDVLNAQGYTQAAWWNRIPFEAWVLLAAIAIGCNLLVGYGAHRQSMLLVVLPLAASLSFFLIADIESPRGGIVRVQPQNLLSLAHSLR
jgi:hypothetical protein